MLVDTHCHINIMIRNFENTNTFQPFTNQEIEACKLILQQAQQHQVTTIINVGTNFVESIASIELARLFPNCFATIGLHPNDATSSWQTDMQKFEELLQQAIELKIIGIGECGIDKHYPNYDLSLQQKLFHAQIQLTLKYNQALVIHSRDADQETYQVLAEYKNEPNFRGTIHCFSSDEKYAQKYIDLGFVLGFGGTVTYPKNEKLRIVAKTVPLSKIILETDAPFLSPQAVRGTKNTPANIYLIAKFIAELRDESLEKIMETTTQNVHRVFGLFAKE